MPNFSVTVYMTYQGRIEAATADEARILAENHAEKLDVKDSVFECQEVNVEVGDDNE